MSETNRGTPWKRRYLKGICNRSGLAAFGLELHATMRHPLFGLAGPVHFLANSTEQEMRQFITQLRDT